MKPLNLKTSILSILVFALGITFGFSQQGKTEINRDPKIDVLMNLMKEMNKNDNDSDRYKIQIYSGNRSGAQKAQSEFKESFSEWYSTDVYEPPNFKIWVGNFRTRLEADRALQQIKKKFPIAFIFKPKK
ncbi:SPOR domain-containing protein [Tamlana crocina]|uniref:SPOR domain-containing protein n=1 Tax=Tamlana crocina TaxID=393006 RepID=A0ABX1DHE9_9FLAO|nr:SPOR domain-containing protein [Tamlana crocina]